MEGTSAKSQNYKNCIVRECTNNSIRTPNKIFISLPGATNSEQLKRRRLWLKAIKRKNEFSKNSKCFVCQDHFNLEEDMINYVKWKLVGGYMVMKKHVVPHIFQGQPKTLQPPEKKCSSKQARKELTQPLLENENKECQDLNHVQDVFTPDCEIIDGVSVISPQAEDLEMTKDDTFHLDIFPVEDSPNPSLTDPLQAHASDIVTPTPTNAEAQEKETNEKRLKRSYSEISKVFKAMKALKDSDPERDVCSKFGEYVTSKLRTYNASTRTSVEHKISLILHEADMEVIRQSQ